MLYLLLTMLLFTFHGTAQMRVPWDNCLVSEIMLLLHFSIYPVNNPAPLSLSYPITSSLLHPSLPRRPLRGRFYSVWITCPSWCRACWWGENLFPPVEPWFKALRSTWFWVIVSPVVMNQGSGRQQTAYRQKQGVGVCLSPLLFALLLIILSDLWLNSFLLLLKTQVIWFLSWSP